jgi:hypothetical protein
MFILYGFCLVEWETIKVALIHLKHNATRYNEHITYKEVWVKLVNMIAGKRAGSRPGNRFTPDI